MLATEVWTDEMTADDLKHRWADKFARRGVDGRFTRLFDHLEPHDQEFLLDRVALVDEELPVIGSVEDTANWFLLTTRRIVSGAEGRTQEISTEALKSVSSPSAVLEIIGPAFKSQNRELHLTTVDDEHFTIRIEPGPPLFAVWNTLLWGVAPYANSKRKGLIS